jgi:quercetin dioxygenase-like cupin family protein
METGTIYNPSLSLTDKMSIANHLFTFDLPSLIENMKHSKTWAKGELKAMILLNKPDTQVLLTALHEKTEINAFQANDSVTIYIVQGELKFNAGKGFLTLREGQFLTLHEKVKYNLTSIEETVFLLTILNVNTRVEEN